MPTNDIHVLIVSEHASAQFGGEAALPLHYFRVLRQRGVETWLLVHDRTRSELQATFPDDVDRIYFIPDTIWHRLLAQTSEVMSTKLVTFTLGYVLFMLTQFAQQRMTRQLVRKHQIQVVHQPMPVSPKAPSMIYGVGAPVIIGPMNGGMNYPPAFQHMQNSLLKKITAIGRWSSSMMNRLMPGKLRAAALIVANQRTKAALPKNYSGRVFELVENGVDLSVWHLPPLKPQPDLESDAQKQGSKTRFVFMGRLVDWKAVDLLLEAFQTVSDRLPMTLEIIGDGDERESLERLAIDLGLTAPTDEAPGHTSKVRFLGWLSQADCAQKLSECDVLVLPSLNECGGAVVLEAMSVELPIIATNWGGPADYVDESCGILVNPTSREEFISGLADAMYRLASSPDLRRSMGQAGRQRVSKHFDWEAKTDAILDIYERVMADYSSQHSSKVSNNALSGLQNRYKKSV